MLRTNPALLQATLEQLEEAATDHAEWRDRVLRVISGREALDWTVLAGDAHRRCLFGRWYFERSLPALQATPSFAMAGGEHEHQHQVAASLLRDVAAGLPVARATIDEFEEASGRFGYALYFIKREIECALSSRDPLTEAHSSGEMARDLRDWHALARQPGRECCIALMALDDFDTSTAGPDDTPGAQVLDAQALATAVKVVATHLRLSDKVFRYDASRFLVRLSGTDLKRGRAVVTRLREAVLQGLGTPDAEGAALQRTASFGIAMLDPDVSALECVDRADQALMLAKAVGGNRMVVWDPSVTTGVRLRRLEVKNTPG